MHKQAIIPPHLQGYLPNCFQKRLTFNISGRSADFRNNHIRIGSLSYTVDKRFNFIGDMRNHLYRFPQIFAIAFFGEDIPIYLSRRQIGILIQILINKALIVT